MRLTSAGRTLPETTNRATIDAEFRLQMFLGRFGYPEAYMRCQKLDGHEEAPKANANRITIGECSPDRDGSSSRSLSVKTLRGIISGSMKLCKKKDIHGENKVCSKKLYHEKLRRIAKGQASVRTKESGSVSTGTSAVQRDQVIDDILAVADMDRLSCAPPVAIQPERAYSTLIIFTIAISW